LVVTPVCPVPPTAGAPLRISSWLRAAAGTAELAVATLVRSPEEASALDELRELLAHVVAVPARRTPSARLRDRVVAALAGRPLSVVANTSRGLRAAAGRLMASWSPDLVQLEQLAAAPYLEPARRHGCAVVYSAHNVESLVAAGPPGGRRSRSRAAQARRTAALETAVATSADRVVAVTSAEAAWFESRGATAVTIPNALWLDELPRRPARIDGGEPVLLFVGHLAYPPNRDGAIRLVRDILPRVRAVEPRVRCVIAGRRPPRELRRLAGLGAEIVADQPDLGPLWERSSVFVCPLRWGGGSRLKLIEAAARGVPITTTRAGVEGLELRSGEDLLVADDDAGMAAAILDVLSDAGATAGRVASARGRVEAHHDWRRLAPMVHELYADLLGHHRRDEAGARA
jgi:glycosyltransferase involved in cell wall biosynthesis